MSIMASTNPLFERPTRSTYEEDCGIRPAVKLLHVGRWLLRITHDEMGVAFWTVRDRDNPEDCDHFDTYVKALASAQEWHAEDLRENALRNFHW